MSDAAASPGREAAGAVTSSALGDVVRMFRRSHAAVFGLVLVVTLAVAAVMAPLLTRHDPNEVDTTRRLARP